MEWLDAFLLPELYASLMLLQGPEAWPWFYMSKSASTRIPKMSLWFLQGAVYSGSETFPNETNEWALQVGQWLKQEKNSNIGLSRNFPLWVRFLGFEF